MRFSICHLFKPFRSPGIRYSRLLPGVLVLGVLFPGSSVLALPADFSNTNTIIINDSTNPPTVATPYPSTIMVTGLEGTIVTKATVQLFNISHTFPDDIDILLVSPQGQKAMIMSNVGGDIRSPVTNVTLNLDDEAPGYLPYDPPLVSGTFKPTKRLQTLTFSFPSPCPPGSAIAAAPLSVFNGIDPSGTWQLFVVDDASADAGLIAGGWSLTLTTTPLLLSIATSGTNVVISWTNAVSGYTLQTTPSLSVPWSNASPAPVIVSGRYTVTNELSQAKGYYRLIK